MASSMLEPAAVAMKATEEARASTEAETTAETDAEEEEEEYDNEINTLSNNKNNNNSSEKNADEASSSTLHMCANDPDFAVICAFFQKFSKDLGIDSPNFKHLQEWLVNTDEVVPQLRDLHIKLLRKARKTVHDKNWESQLSKYCFTYSAQDAWEIERFGYKKSSLKVKLSVLLILLESQFERNVKFRANCLTMSADSLRGQPIGRDRLGHAYYVTQDSDCNLRIYQEHLDEEIWQVVATNREELVNLIARLRGNEVVLPSTDIGVVDEDSSSNSCAAVIPKPPPPVEQDDSQEDECAKVPTMRIKLNAANGQSCVTNEPKKTKRDVDVEAGEKHVENGNNTDVIAAKNKKEEENLSTKDNRRKVKPLIITPTKTIAANTPKKRLIEDVDISPTHNVQQAYKKSRPSLLQSKRVSQKDEREADEEEEGEEMEADDEEGEEEEEDFDSEGEDIDSAAADEGDDDQDIEEDDDDDDDGDEQENGVVGETIEEPTLIVRGQGAGKDCQEGNASNKVPTASILSSYHDVNTDETVAEVGEAIEEPVLYVIGEGSGEACLVGNTKNDEAECSNKKSTPNTPEPKATFFFGEPGCLKLSPMKNSSDDNPVKKFSLFGSWLKENKEQKRTADALQAKDNVEKYEKTVQQVATQAVLEKNIEIDEKMKVENENVHDKEAACTNVNLKDENKTETAEGIMQNSDVAQSNEKPILITKSNGDFQEIMATKKENINDDVSSSSNKSDKKIEVERGKTNDDKINIKCDNEVDADKDKIIDDEVNSQLINATGEAVEEQSKSCDDNVKAKLENNDIINEDTVCPDVDNRETIGEIDVKKPAICDTSLFEVDAADSVKADVMVNELNQETKEGENVVETMTENEQNSNNGENTLEVETEDQNKAEPFESINKSPKDLDQNPDTSEELYAKEEIGKKTGGMFDENVNPDKIKNSVEAKEEENCERESFIAVVAEASKEEEENAIKELKSECNIEEEKNAEQLIEKEQGPINEDEVVKEREPITKENELNKESEKVNFKLEDEQKSNENILDKKIGHKDIKNEDDKISSSSENVKNNTQESNLQNPPTLILTYKDAIRNELSNEFKDDFPHDTTTVPEAKNTSQEQLLVTTMSSITTSSGIDNLELTIDIEVDLNQTKLSSAESESIEKSNRNVEQNKKISNCVQAKCSYEFETAVSDLSPKPAALAEAGDEIDAHENSEQCPKNHISLAEAVKLTEENESNKSEIEAESTQKEFKLEDISLENPEQCPEKCISLAEPVQLTEENEPDKSELDTESTQKEFKLEDVSSENPEQCPEKCISLAEPVQLTEENEPDKSELNTESIQREFKLGDVSSENPEQCPESRFSLAEPVQLLEENQPIKSEIEAESTQKEFKLEGISSEKHINLVQTALQELQSENIISSAESDKQFDSYEPHNAENSEKSIEKEIEISLPAESIEEMSVRVTDDHLTVQLTLEEKGKKNIECESDNSVDLNEGNIAYPAEAEVKFKRASPEELSEKAEIRLKSPGREIVTLESNAEEQHLKYIEADVPVERDTTTESDNFIECSEKQIEFSEDELKSIQTEYIEQVSLKTDSTPESEKPFERDESDNFLKCVVETPIEELSAKHTDIATKSQKVKTIQHNFESQHWANIESSPELEKPFEDDKSQDFIKSTEEELKIVVTPIDEISIKATNVNLKSPGNKPEPHQAIFEKEQSFERHESGKLVKYTFKSPEKETTSIDQLTAEAADFYSKEPENVLKPSQSYLEEQCSTELNELHKEDESVKIAEQTTKLVQSAIEDNSSKDTDLGLKSPKSQDNFEKQHLKNMDSSPESCESIVRDEPYESENQSLESELKSSSTSVFEPNKSNYCVKPDLFSKSAKRELKPLDEISIENQTLDYSSEAERGLKEDEFIPVENYVKCPENEGTPAQEVVEPFTNESTAVEITLEKQPELNERFERYEFNKTDVLDKSPEIGLISNPSYTEQSLVSKTYTDLKSSENDVFPLFDTTQVIKTTSPPEISLDKTTEQLQKIKEANILHTPNLMEPSVAVAEIISNSPTFEAQTVLSENNSSVPLDLAFTSIRKENSSTVLQKISFDNLDNHSPLNLTAIATDFKEEQHSVCTSNQSSLTTTLQPVFRPFNIRSIYSSTQYNVREKIAMPITSVSTEDDKKTQPTSNIFPNRKRRLADNSSHVLACTQSTSDSEIDLHSEQMEPTIDSDLEEGDVGGKRIKMRTKQANIEQRKKVEAQKIPADEATSSSGEEEARRRRKIISPKRNSKNPSSFFTNKDSEKSPEATSSKLSRQSSDDSVQQLILDNTTEVSRKMAPFKLAGHKQKPTLAEIIEKKLRKSNVTAQLNTITTDTAESSTEIPAEKISPPKKLPITKPLKKNLLTQLRHDSDDEPIPRKRTISEVMAEAACMSKEPFESPSKIDKQIGQNICENLSRQQTRDRKTPDRQRKRRSSDEVRSSTETPTAMYDDASEVIGEKHKRNNDDLPVKMIELTQEVVLDAVFEEKKTEKPIPEIRKDVVTSPTTTTDNPSVELTVGRRSGRRGGAAVVYSELPQVKRTRGGAAKEKKEVNNCNTEQIPSQPKKETKATKKDSKVKEKESQKKVAEEKNVKDKTDILKDEKRDLEEKKEVEEIEIKKDNSISPQADKLTENDNAIKDDEGSKEKSPAPNPCQNETPTTSNAVGSGRGRGGRKKREVDTSNIIEATDSETPVRQSRRIAQLKIREEAERRKLEEIALRNMKQEFKKKKKAEQDFDPAVAEPSEHSSSEESAVESKRKVKKKCPGKDGWSSGSEEQEEPDEEEEPPHYETDPGSPLFKSDHEFSPESDIGDESQVVPMKRARTARNEDADEDDNKNDEQACQNCSKSDHPEWILLCDKCDKGYHCSCLSPVLFYIPEGDWYCPPCQQAELIQALENRLLTYDEDMERKRLAVEEEKRKAQEAQLAESERILEEEKIRKQRRELKKNRNSHSSDDIVDNRKLSTQQDSKDSESDNEDEKCLSKLKNTRGADKSKRRRAEAKNRNRRAARRGNRRQSRRISGSQIGSESGSSDSRGATNPSRSSGSDSSAPTDSDDEPIYKLRKRRQINVSYRLNEYDEIINSALKKEMEEVAGAGNLGRGKDITTIIEADKEEKARQKHTEDGEEVPDKNDELNEVKEEKENNLAVQEKVTSLEKDQEKDEKEKELEENSDSDDAPIIRRKSKGKGNSKKSRKLTTLDISSEEDHASDEDFKTSSLEDEEDEDTTFSGSSESDSSLEIYKRKAGKPKERRRAARERRKDRKFIYDESEEDDVPVVKTKKKRKVDTDYEESEDDDEDASENSENVDSADLCDDTTSDSSDGAWQPSSKKKKKKSKSNTIARKSPKLKKPIIAKKKKRATEYSDDDISESEEEEDDDYYNGVSGKGSGKQPRSQPLKTSASAKECNKGVGKGKGKGKGKTPSGKSESKNSGEESFSDSGDSARRTRGRRYAYLEDFDDDSSDGGIKPGVKRPDTPPEEREKFIKRQEEIKRMLAEKNAEGAKLAATPRLTPIKATTAEKRTPSKATDSLSTVPLSVIRQAKVLDKDYLQRIGDLETAQADEEVDGPEFDDADLPYDFPEDMDEDAIARMVEEEDFAAASRELPPADEVVRSSLKSRSKQHAAVAAEIDKGSIPSASASLAAMAQIHSVSTTGLQEPVRKRLPMPTMHPPLLRHQPVSVAAIQQNISAVAVAAAAAQILTRHPSPPSYLLQSALTSPLGQPLNRNFPSHRGMPQLPPNLAARPPAAHAPMSQSAEPEPKPRGRRKKITPLRDALQKQQAAAAASSAPTSVVTTPSVTTTAPKSNSRSQMQPTSIPVSGVIKSAISSSISSATPTSSAALSVAQPPQLYKRAGEMPPEGQPSVITRMPLLPPHATPPLSSSRHQHGRPPVSVAGQLPPTSIFQSVADVARFYAPQQSFPPGARSLPSSMVTQRMPRGAHPGPGGLPLQLSGLPPHHSMRPTYGPPPPLRGSAGGPLPNHGQPPTTGAAGVTRSPYASVTQAGDSQGHGVYAVPPPARHATAHLNPYRPTIYGNPNFAPRAPFSGSNLRHTGPPGGPDYAASARPYPPYAYYPPPPPLTTPTQPQQQQQHTTSQSSSSRGSTTPSAQPSSVIVSAPPSAERVAAALNAPMNQVSTIISRSSAVKSPTVTTLHNQKQPSVLVDSRRKLTTLDVYSTTKSPLAMGGESSGSRSSPGGEETHATPAAHTTVIASSSDAGAENKASEFSGLVSYFSSQHDDYNT